MMNHRFSNIAASFCFVLFLLCLPFSAGQDVPAEPLPEGSSEAEPAGPLKIMLSVKEVRLDAVVLDKNGNPITDLTAEDFEVYQDGKRQELLASVYIDAQSDAAPQPAGSQKDAPARLGRALEKEDVRRAIVFVVDDYSMSFENGYYAKMALRNFVEKQMQPGDMVAILRTAYGNSALNMFQSDKREVLARINAFPSANVSVEAMLPEQRAQWQGRLVANQVSTISYSISALKNMPGRKIIIMASRLHVNESLEAFSPYQGVYNTLADDAMRAGVVINILDMEGLSSYILSGADASGGLAPPLGNTTYFSMSSAGIFGVWKPYMPPIRATESLSEKTGGVTIKGSNFFLDGIGKETESLMKGYYLISYVPPQDTFNGRGGKDDYRRLRVRVKRSGAVVHTRDGFFGRLESGAGADAPKQSPLIEAIHSPFQSTDLNVDIAAGYVKDAKAGYLVRAWVHLDPRDVKIIETEGGARIDLEAVYVASDVAGNIQDSSRMEFTLSKFNVDWVTKHGIRFSMLLPVKKPGPYYIRISIQDKETGKVGSAYQFLDIPDVGKGGPALSDIFMITSADDLAWMNSDATEEAADGVFFPVFQGEEVRSPALRAYKRGDNLVTLAMLYNADARAVGRSEVETQIILYKDGAEFLRGSPSPVTSGQAGDPGGIPILNKLAVGPNMPPGSYVLQLVVTDKKNSRNNGGAASQTLSFTVVE